MHTLAGKVNGLALSRLEQESSCGGLVKLSNTVEDRCLTCSVRAYQTENFPFVYVKAQIIHGFHTAKVHFQAVNMQRNAITKAHAVIRSVQPPDISFCAFNPCSEPVYALCILAARRFFFSLGIVKAVFSDPVAKLPGIIFAFFAGFGADAFPA